ncbi:YihY family inner membrane protein [Marinomonas sp. M1K-6]|uniref:YihY family inner membrane protein n=1 Tax=Marinomonas profundi TaxID=2726122 RepID=A0A847QWX6_9GAMM|nr:YihY family inner membrane protein [Marinomonas profundi]NLQ16779.1 YihY family inner membrane protein [Marinomonas profundi]UDV02513.1 YihY family inner membrane protein [Marinomonas profundi]
MPERLLYLLLTLKRYGHLTIARYQNSNLSQRAAQLTLSSLLAAVPIITIIAGILSFTPALESMQNQLFQLLEQHLAPGSSDIILPYLIQFSAQTKNLPIAGLIALFLTALLLLNSFENSVQSIWEIKKPRKLRERLLTYWAILTLGPIIFAASLSLYGTLISMQLQNTEANNWLNNLLELGTITLYFLMLLTLNFLTPNADVSIKWASISALAGSLGLYILNTLFGSFAQFFAGYQVVYGAFAAIPIFLIWLQSSWLIVLASICLCATLHNIKNIAQDKNLASGQD